MFLKSLIFLIFAGYAYSSMSDSQDIRLELDKSKPVNLADYGGPHIEIYIRENKISSIATMVTDYTRMIPVAKTRIQSVVVDNYRDTATVYGSTRSTTQPTRSRPSIPKENGIPIPNSLSRMFSIYYEPTSGINVYLLDVISSQNQNTVIVSVPKPKSEPTPSPDKPAVVIPKSEPVMSSQEKKTGQPLTPELFLWYIELQKKREFLDVSKPTEVAKFNLHVAAYNRALKRARLAQSASTK